MVDVPAYLARISYTGLTSPTYDTLRALHYSHMLAVPFENLDIALGRKIVLDEDAILRKVIHQTRGGFCYELNGAFAALLRALGFQTTLLSARVARDTGGESPEFDHLTLRVDLAHPWLVDVGFGESFLEPLRLESERNQIDPAGTFRLMPTPGRLQLEKLGRNGDWKRQYTFAQAPRSLHDFAGMCHYHQTSPESHFTQNRICSRATPEGRITLSGMKLIVTRNDHREESELASEDEWAKALQQYFDIELHDRNLPSQDTPRPGH